jgi:uncharacterized protein
LVTPVLVDTSALLVLLDRSDARHEAARATFVELAGAELVTSGYIVAESLAVARRRFGVDGAIALIDGLLPALEVLPVTPKEHAAVLEAYRGSLPTGISFVDRVTLHVMGRDSITTAFAFDPDLATDGVTLIPDQRT